MKNEKHNRVIDVGEEEEIQTKHKRKREEAKSDVNDNEEVLEDPDCLNIKKKEKKKKKKEKKEKKDKTKNEEAERGFLLGSNEIQEKKKKKNNRGSERTNLRNGMLSDYATMCDDIHGTDQMNGKKLKERKSNGFANGEVRKHENGEDKNVEMNGSETGEGGGERISHGGVAVSGKNVRESKYEPLKYFSDSGLPTEVLECCKDFMTPSPIQSHAWPFLLDGRDFVGIAATGSGKTLAYGIPAVMHVLGKRKGDKSKAVNPLCLVLSPTRELAQQIADVLCDAGKPCAVKVACVYGGTSKGRQMSALKAGVDIVIGTPGRLKDLIEIGACCLKEVSFVVLDEADRMLDQGFEPAVRSILSQACSARQMVMFSATWPTPVQQLAQEFMDPNPVKVVVGSEDLSANHDVMQIVEVIDDRSRDKRLVDLLEKYHKSQKNRVLVFVLYKKEAPMVENMLRGRGWKVVSIHGDKDQHARTSALSLFKNGSCPLLIATDVAARGLDIPDVEVVINYSFPLSTEDYVHRIGRTGRAGKKGVAHTFFTQQNKGLAGELVNVLREARQIVPAALLNFGTHVKKKESKLYGAHFREIAADAPKSSKITFDNSDED
ncbi:hypothetical protein Nepgr_024424 [Nepenthes gracilis]|uniref:RNA helicase n=1 Tax=Nepenthes gracilis TaxID=150966 RepID=A0AAD3T5Z2_NEPGR|nr:hypothetical protein Nepgr_024424 [Nepenthes gracilis]